MSGAANAMAATNNESTEANSSDSQSKYRKKTRKRRGGDGEGVGVGSYGASSNPDYEQARQKQMMVAAMQRQAQQITQNQNYSTPEYISKNRLNPTIPSPKQQRRSPRKTKQDLKQQSSSYGANPKTKNARKSYGISEKPPGSVIESEL